MIEIVTAIGNARSKPLAMRLPTESLNARSGPCSSRSGGFGFGSGTRSDSSVAEMAGAQSTPRRRVRQFDSPGALMRARPDALRDPQLTSTGLPRNLGRPGVAANHPIPGLVRLETARGPRPMPTATRPASDRATENDLYYCYRLI